MPDLAALVLDVDGTLADTEEVHRRAFNETFAEAGLYWHWSRADYARLLTTNGGKERMARHAAEMGDDPAALPIAELHAAKTSRYGALIAGGAVTLRPGVARLIGAARAAGLRLGVATTTSPPNVDALCLATFGMAAGQVFDAVAAGDQVRRKKPDPEVYLLALRLLGLPARAALAFEDSRNGLLSALGAGLACIVTPTAYTEAEDFTGATAVLDSLEDFTLPVRTGESHGRIPPRL